PADGLAAVLPDRHAHGPVPQVTEVVRAGVAADLAVEELLVRLLRIRAAAAAEAEAVVAADAAEALAGLFMLGGELRGEGLGHFPGRREDQRGGDHEEAGGRGDGEPAAPREHGGGGRGVLGPREAPDQALGGPLGAEFGPQRSAQGLLALVDRGAGAAEVEVFEDLEVLRNGELAVHEQVEMVLGVVALHERSFSWRVPCRAKSASSRLRIPRARKRRLITVPIGTPRIDE